MAKVHSNFENVKILLRNKKVMILKNLLILANFNYIRAG